MNTAAPLELADQLRGACRKLRTSPMPVAQLVPLLQRAADMIERLNDPTGVLAADPRDAQGKPLCRACGMSEAERRRYANGCPMNAPELSCPRWAEWRAP